MIMRCQKNYVSDYDECNCFLQWYAQSDFQPVYNSPVHRWHLLTALTADSLNCVDKQTRCHTVQMTRPQPRQHIIMIQTPSYTTSAAGKGFIAILANLVHVRPACSWARLPAQGFLLVLCSNYWHNIHSCWAMAMGQTDRSQHHLKPSYYRRGHKIESPNEQCMTDLLTRPMK